MPYHRTVIAPPTGPPPRTFLAEGVGEVRMRNACLSALSPHALSLLSSYLRETMFRQGSTVAEMRHDKAKLAFLMTAREKKQWLL